MFNRLKILLCRVTKKTINLKIIPIIYDKVSMGQR